MAVVKGSSPKVLLGPLHQLLCLKAKDFWEAQGIGLEVVSINLGPQRSYLGCPCICVSSRESKRGLSIPSKVN